jgi:multiple sugar transport system ATP-binding protein
VQQVDTPLGIYNKPANRFVAGFIGSPTMNFFEGTLTADGGISFLMSEGGITLRLPDRDRGRFAQGPGKELTMGIRPEHITAKSQGEASKKVPVRIEVTEPLGNEIFLYFTMGSTSLQHVSRIASDIQPQAGKEFDLYFDTSKLHFFDKATGNAM